ncbi:nuclear transport factor 2 family protein (plasmid) [Pseudoalteromonas sp. T1lg65]|uniref:nuclear transport factor 2 family protein n=1 Tax=Pseudoalteromonas sp. T1lg65 TaxID=2077101 RepID=UPI003F7B1209
MVRDIDAISDLVQTYFDGLHHGDSEKLKRIFHPDTVLKAPDLRRDLLSWLSLVETREAPAALGLAWEYRVLSIDIINQQAMVKALCPLLGRTYIDFLGLLKEHGQWLIVNKMYADN